MKTKTNRSFLRVMTILMAVMMVFTMMPITPMVQNGTALAETQQQVRVIVENTTCSTEKGAEWDGTLVETWVDLNNDSTMISCVAAALKSVSATAVGIDSGYISEINGLAAKGAGGNMSGWMGTLNDWFTNYGFGAYTVADETLKEGDEIRIMYTCDNGEDLGGIWNNTDKTVKDIAVSGGSISPSFSPDTHAYTLTLGEDVSAVTVTPTASNKNYQVRTSVNGKEYQRTAAIPVFDGTVITVTCGDKSWPTMNNNDGDAQTYTLTVSAQTAVSVTGVSIDKETLELKVGDSENLTATIAPENATKKGVKWDSTDETVATVADGTVTAVAAGETTITVTTIDGEFKDTCTVIVTEKIANALILTLSTTPARGVKNTKVSAKNTAGETVNCIFSLADEYEGVSLANNGKFTFKTAPSGVTVNAVSKTDPNLTGTLTFDVVEPYTVKAVGKGGALTDLPVYIAGNNYPYVVVTDGCTSLLVNYKNNGVTDTALTDAKSQKYSMDKSGFCTLHLNDGTDQSGMTIPEQGKMLKGIAMINTDGRYDDYAFGYFNTEFYVLWAPPSFVPTAVWSEGGALYTPVSTNSYTMVGGKNGSSSFCFTIEAEKVWLSDSSFAAELQTVTSSGSNTYKVKIENGETAYICVQNADGDQLHLKVSTLTRNNPEGADTVADYLCLASQYTNNDNYGTMPERTLVGKNAAGQGTGNNIVSLGNFGGYIVYRFNEPILNSDKHPYGVDFFVNGNSMGGSSFSEPGNVLVSQDGSTWYTLAGSAHYDANAIWGYTMTYTKSSAGKADWTDNAGNSGTSFNYPSKKKYPLAEWTAEMEQTITVSGTLLVAEGTDSYGSTQAAYPDWGYVDTSYSANPYLGGGETFDISWAVDENGLPVKLDSISYIKVQCASNINAGATGEKSTEVSAVGRMADADAAVGQTPAPVIKVNNSELKLKGSGCVCSGLVSEGNTVEVMAASGANIYINGTKGASAEFDALPPHGIVRIIVQEGEKEPYIVYVIKGSANTIPSLAENISATAEAGIELGETYTLSLGSVFTDEDGDELSYTVKIGNADAIAADAVYTYTPNAAGKYTLVFKANDGTADSTDTYTVTLTVTSVEWAGSGTEQDPYQLANSAHLKLLSDRSAENNYANTYFKFVKDITLPAGWTPVGTALKRFNGTIDGDGHLLTVPAGEKALLGATENAALKNLNIYGENINGNGVVSIYTTGSTEPCIIIENVTLRSGTKTSGSGFISGYASGSHPVTIRNCTVEEGVTIGDGTASNIGSFGGDFNGTVIGCVSHATVKGVNYVGGICGNKGQTMGDYVIIDCIFDGTVKATGNYAGGISGGGYGGTTWGLASAPYTPCVTILNCLCSGNITGADYVGGILGAEPGVKECWNNGVGYIQSNLFTGFVTATAENAKIGGIVGYLSSLNNAMVISDNYYLSTAAAKGIGLIEMVEVPESSGSFGTGSNKYTLSGAKYGRTDDPTGADADKLTKAVTSAELTDGSVLKKLNAGMNSSGNWIQDTAYPVFTAYGEKHLVRIVCTALNNSNGVSQILGEDVLEGKTLTLQYSDGSTGTLSATDQIVVKGYAPTKDDCGKFIPATITVQGHQLEFNLAIKAPAPLPSNITVYFTLMGDTQHGAPASEADTHTLKAGNLSTWVAKKSYSIEENSTVWDLMKLVASQTSGLSFENASGNYVSAITYNNVTLSDSDNGQNCGWMYTLNGSHPNLGVAEQKVKNGDVIVFHYTDDYTKEEGSEKWTTPEDKGSVPTVTKSTDGSVTAQATAEVKVTGGTAKATVDSKTATELVKQAKDNKATEVKLEVKAADTKNAKTIQAELPKSALSDIAGKTDAALVLATPQGEVKLDNKVLDEIAKAAAGTNVTIEIKAAAPTLEQTNTIGKSAQVIELTITSGSKTIGEFNGGTATFASELPKALDGKRTAAICIKADGTLEVLPSKVIEVSGKKHIEFTTSHFSTFAIVDADEAGISEEQITQAGKKNEKLIAGVNATKMTAKSSITKNSKGKKAIKISWIQSKGYKVDYYEVCKSTKKNSGYKKLYTTVDSNKKSLVTSKNLKKGKTYYFKVRGVRMIDGKKYYTNWSNKVSKTYK